MIVIVAKYYKMKKLVMLLLTLLLCGCTIDNSTNKEMDHYVRKNLYLNLLPDIIDGTYSIGLGITVENVDKDASSLYPIYKNDQGLGWVECIEKNGEYRLIYPSNYTDGINDILKETGSISVFKYNDVVYGYNGNKLVDLAANENVGIEILNEEMPSVIEYDMKKRVILDVPEFSASVKYLWNRQEVKLTKEERDVLYQTFLQTDIITNPDLSLDVIGYRPFFEYTLTYGDKMFVIDGNDPIGMYSFQTKEENSLVWSFADPYGYLFDYNRELMLKYAPNTFKNNSDYLYTICSQEKIQRISFNISDSKSIDWGMYIVCDSAKMQDVLNKMNLDLNVGNMTALEFYASKTAGVLEINKEIETEDFFMKLVGTCDNGSCFYIKLKNF